MKNKNKIRKGKRRMDVENNNRAFKIYHENKHGHFTPWGSYRRKPKRGEKKPKYKDHK